MGRGSIYTLATAAPMLAGVLILPVLTRQLSISEYGHVAVALVVIQFGTSVAGLGLPTAITRHALVSSSGAPGARGIALLAGLFAASLALISALALALWSAVTGVGGVGVYVLAVLAAGAGAAIANVQAYSLAVKDAWFYVRITVGLGFLAPAAGLAVVIVWRQSAEDYLIGMVAIYVVTGAVAIAKVVRTRPISMRRADSISALRVGLPMLPYLLSIGLASGSTILVSNHFFGLSAGAELQVAISVGSIPLILTSAINNAWMPAILAAPEGERGARLEETAVDVAWLAAIAAGGVAALSPWLLRLVSSDQYDRAAMVPVVSVIGVAACVASVFLANLQLVVAAGATGGLSYLSPMSLGLGIATAVLLAPHLGLSGIAMGFVAVYVSLAIVTRVMGRGASTSRWRQRLVIPPLVATVAFAGLGAYLPTAGSGSLTRIAFAAVLLVLALRRLRMTFRGAAVSS